MNEEVMEKVMLDCIGELGGVTTKLQHLECPLIHRYSEHLEVLRDVINEVLRISEEYVINQEGHTDEKL